MKFTFFRPIAILLASLTVLAACKKDEGLQVQDPKQRTELTVKATYKGLSLTKLDYDQVPGVNGDSIAMKWSGNEKFSFFSSTDSYFRTSTFEVTSLENPQTAVLQGQLFGAAKGGTTEVMALYPEVLKDSSIIDPLSTTLTLKGQPAVQSINDLYKSKFHYMHAIKMLEMGDRISTLVFSHKVAIVKLDIELPANVGNIQMVGLSGPNIYVESKINVRTGGVTNKTPGEIVTSGEFQKTGNRVTAYFFMFANDMKDAKVIVADENATYISDNVLKTSSYKLVDGRVYTFALDGGKFTSWFSGGQGTVQNPYRIAKPKDLMDMSVLINSKDWGYFFNDKAYKLTSDINMSEVVGENVNGLPIGWEPIGDNNIPFLGTFDGGGHTISNLFSSNSYKYYGLIGYAGKTSHVKNVTVEGATLKEGVNGGAVVGYLDKTAIVSDCQVSKSTISSTTYQASLGGVVGYNNGGVITNCSAIDVTIAASNVQTYVGGIVGWHFNGLVAGCTTTEGDIRGSRAGGIAGCNYGNGSGVICNVTRGVMVTGDYSGGVVGSNYSAAMISGSVALAKELAGAVRGGLVGYNVAGRVKSNVWLSVSGSYGDGATTAVGYIEGDADINQVAMKRASMEAVNQSVEALNVAIKEWNKVADTMKTDNDMRCNFHLIQGADPAADAPVVSVGVPQ